MLRNKLILICFVAILGGVGCSKETTYKDTHGNQVTFSQQKGKWVVFSYWATWCNYCRKEIPALNEFYQAHKDQVQLWGVNYDHLIGEALQTASDEVGIEYPVLEGDPRKEFGYSPINGIPMLIAVTPEGEVLPPFAGHEGLDALIERIDDQG